MKLAYSTNAFRKYSLEETIRILSSIGYSGIEIMCDTPHAWPPDLDDRASGKIKDILAERRMEIANLNAFMMCAVGDFHHPSWIEPDPAQRAQRISHTIACVELAKRWGAKNISTEPGGPVDGTTDREKAMALFIAGLREAAGHASRAGVKILVEPEPDLLIETSGEFRDFFKDAAHDAVGLNFDIGHFFCVGEDPAKLIAQFGSLVTHVHLEDIAKDRKHFHLPPGKGVIDFPSIFAALAEIRYQGWITVELYPFQDDAPKIAEDAFHYLQKYV